MDRIYHIVARADWVQTSGPYRHPSLESEGFIHCSRRDKVAWVANLFYADQKDLVVLAIDPAKLTSEMKDEVIDTGDVFPHVYGPINQEAVVDVLPLQRGTNGRWVFD